ncbi:hypothetical protein NEUTE2DRAFT_68823, partial [Neurospora tetrasperma FGSC 2509]
KKISITKVLKVVALLTNYEGGVILTIITSNASPVNSRPINRNTPIIINILKKVKKYLAKENLNKKELTCQQAPKTYRHALLGSDS